jgi:hypothetical protein
MGKQFSVVISGINDYEDNFKVTADSLGPYSLKPYLFLNLSAFTHVLPHLLLWLPYIMICMGGTVFPL